MITMKGKYNNANIMIDEIDDSTKEQIQTMLNHPAFAKTYIAIMPDCHAGAGAVIGFTMKTNGYIIPNIVGVDIGCGMLSVKIDKKSVDLALTDDFIKQNIPHGFSINQVKQVKDIREIKETCTRLDLDYEKVMRSIGSLGGGNHFIEIGRDEEENLWITIHSGSRNFGLKVAGFYQKKAKENLKKYFIEGQYKDLEFLLMEEPDGMDYYHDLFVAQRMASLNRKTMMDAIIKFLGCSVIHEIESVHNFIGDDDIIRKGATPANLGQEIVIPFNMRDGLILAKGKGNQKYNFSAPHGAGRILSRKKARETLDSDLFVSDMKANGIYSTTANASTIDEAPGAYKDMNVIIENIKETVDVVHTVKPIYNFKSS